jgi:hypothetical protein
MLGALFAVGTEGSISSVRFESGRVLVFDGGVFGCSSRMNGKPSSPVLRGLGASNGARLVDRLVLGDFSCTMTTY